LRVEGSKGSVLTLSPDRRLLASGLRGLVNTDGEYDYTVHVWEMATGRGIAKWQPGSASTTSLAFARDGKRLISGLGNGTSLIWEVIASRAGPELAGPELERLWSDLAGDEAAKAYAAVGRLVVAPEKSVRFLEGRLPASTGVKPEQLQQLIADLNNEQFSMREAATKELERLGDLAVEAFRKALADEPSFEMKRR